MKNSMVSVVKLGLIAMALAALAYSSTAMAKKPAVDTAANAQNQVVDEYAEIYSDGTTLHAGGFRACPRDMSCPDVYNPVTCSNGVTYPNACYAYVACATGCGSGGS